jgi:hypothetical protein
MKPELHFKNKICQALEHTQDGAEVARKYSFETQSTSKLLLILIMTVVVLRNPKSEVKGVLFLIIRN